MTELRYPTGRQHSITHGGQLAVVTEVGGSLREYTSDGMSVVDGYRATEICPASHGMPLLPWPNRIIGATYRFEGQTHLLPVDRPDDGSAIHGLTRWLSWRPAAETKDRIDLELELHPRPGYPFHLLFRNSYRLTGAGLVVSLTVDNVGATTAPFGAGYHPYISPLGSLADCMLQLEARRCLEHDERGVPGEPFNVSGTHFDFTNAHPINQIRLAHCYTELKRDEHGRAWVTVDGTSVWLGAGFKWVLLFTGDALPDPALRRRALAVEPMTCPADAFNSRCDLISLEPGQRLLLQWGIRPRSAPRK